jgi:hypothetical protein
VWSGTASGGPFSNKASLTSSESNSAQYGKSVIGGGMSGRTTTFSFIGGSRSDIAISTRANNNYRLYILDGDKVPFGGVANIEGVADVIVPLIGNYLDYSRNITAIPDLDGDGYGDLAVAEVDTATTPASGHVVIIR